MDVIVAYEYVPTGTKNVTLQAKSTDSDLSRVTISSTEMWSTA